MKKRTLLTLALICALIFSLAAPICASLLYNNIRSTDGNAFISGSTLYTIAEFTGTEDITESVTVEIKVEKKTLLLFWSEVETWTDTVNNWKGSVSHSLALSNTGNYRVTITYTAEGTGGDADEITETFNLTY